MGQLASPSTPEIMDSVAPSFTSKALAGLVCLELFLSSSLPPCGHGLDLRAPLYRILYLCLSMYNVQSTFSLFWVVKQHRCQLFLPDFFPVRPWSVALTTYRYVCVYVCVCVQEHMCPTTSRQSPAELLSAIDSRHRQEDKGPQNGLTSFNGS